MLLYGESGASVPMNYDMPKVDAGNPRFLERRDDHTLHRQGLSTMPLYQSVMIKHN